MKKAIIILIILWLSFILQQFFGLDFINFGGICPRSQPLWGIITYIFVHSNIAHLIANSTAIFILTWLLNIFYKKIAFILWWLISITTGLLVWLLGRSSTCHVGISGLIFGLIGFILASGVFRIDLKSLLAAIIVAILYGATLWSNLLPTDKHISWEGHILGFITGVIYAYLFRNINKKSEIQAEQLQNKDY